MKTHNIPFLPEVKGEEIFNWT